MSDLARITGTLNKNRATVFVHLPASVRTVTGKLSVNGRIVVEMPNRSFAKVELKPGVHVIDLKFPAITGPNCEEYTFNFQKDTVYHLVMMDGPKSMSLAALVIDEFLYSSAYLRPVDSFEGIELSRTEGFVERGQQ